jgi:SNF2 family DNA or RNA helicase
LVAPADQKDEKLHRLFFQFNAKTGAAELVAAEERHQATIAELEAPSYTPRPFDLQLPPRDYQRLAADLALRTNRLLIADDIGLGKTVSAICTLTAPGALPALVVTLAHLPRQWEREIHRFAPGLRVHRLRSGAPYNFADLKFEIDSDGKRVRVPPTVPDVIVTNYHKLDSWVDTLAPLIKTVVFDEIQELRIAGSLKYAAASALSEAVSRRIGLSATPIFNYGAEIFSVLDVLSPGVLGTRDEFYQEWCGGGGAEVDSRKVCVRDPVALGTYLRASGLMIRRTRKEVGRELPPLTIVRHVVDVDHARINEVAADVRELAERVLARTGTAQERMRWSGEIDYRMRQATGLGKAVSVVDFVRMLVEAGENVVLYGWHRAVYDIWGSAFTRVGIPYAMYTGAESEAEKAAGVANFIAGDVKVLIVSLRAGAGIDGLQRVNRTVVVGELDWSPQVHTQNIGRSYRDGQHDPVLAYFLVAEEGSDPVIADVLGLKEAQATGIMDPSLAGVSQFVGASPDHIRRLAEDILQRHPTIGVKEKA